MNDVKVLLSASWEFINADYDLEQRKRKAIKELKDALEKESIIQSLIRNDWNVTRSSGKLGISRWTLINKKKKYNISRVNKIVGSSEINPAV